MSSDQTIEFNSFETSRSFNRVELNKRSSSTSKFSPMNDFILHLSLLLRKNWIIQKRSIRLSLLQLLSPFFVCIFLSWMQSVTSGIANQIEANPSIIEIGKIPRCEPGPDALDNCVTILYSIIGESEEWMHNVMNYVADCNDLTINQDIKYLGIKNSQDYMQHLVKNPNQTYMGVIFCNDRWELENGGVIPCKFETQTSDKLLFYNIVYNSSHNLNDPMGGDFSAAFPKDKFITKLKLDLDNGILAQFDKNDGKNSPRMEIKIQDFPKLALRFWSGMDMVAIMGAFLFLIPYLILFIGTSMEIAREKHKKLRQGLAVMGMSTSAYYMSWLLTGSSINLLTSLNIMIAGHLFQYRFFTDTPFIVLFSIFVLFGEAMIALSFWITTICSNFAMSYTLTYGFLFLSVVLEYYMSNNYLCYLIFMEDPPLWLWLIRSLLRMLPAFNYSILFGGVSMRSGLHFELDTNYWVQGPGFQYQDLERDQSVEIYDIKYTVPSMWWFFGQLVMNMALYLFLAWYCDNLGYLKKESFRSPFKWIFRKASSSKKYSHLESTNDQDSPSVESERQKVLQNESRSSLCSGLRIIGLDKYYEKLNFLKSQKLIHAVKDVYLEVNNGELLALLGHNGAGKTTLFAMLTGLEKPSSGTAFIHQYRIEDEMSQIRQIMGVCPQFDILWDELTAEEHLDIFAKLKRISFNKIPTEIEKRLIEVNLNNIKKIPVSAFSGGMKRRLSMAIAFVGNPDIVFLDEPTTGMDPKNRRYIWELIQKMKKGRSIILTTHAMEEADILSDRIAVISKGRLKCVGTSLYLKANYGDGYRLSLVVKREDSESVLNGIKEMVPSINILDSSGGSIILGITNSCVDELHPFLKMMDKDDEYLSETEKNFKRKIKDWGLSHTTLEEVFMKVSSF